MTDQVQDTTQTDTAQDAGQTFSAEYVAKLRQEAANYRTQLRDVETQVKTLQPLAEQYQAKQEAEKTEQQKLVEQMQQMQAQIDAAQAQAAQATQQAKLVTLATKAGVNPDLLPFLNTAAFDMTDEAGALEALKQLAMPKNAGGSASNPATGKSTTETDADRRTRLFGGGQTYIFGGNS